MFNYEMRTKVEEALQGTGAEINVLLEVLTIHIR